MNLGGRITLLRHITSYLFLLPLSDFSEIHLIQRFSHTSELNPLSKSVENFENFYRAIKTRM